MKQKETVVKSVACGYIFRGFVLKAGLEFSEFFRALQAVTSLLLTSRTLRSSTAGLLEIPSNNCEKSGDAVFVSYAPKLWNILPLDIFRTLKTYLFFYLT